MTNGEALMKAFPKLKIYKFDIWIHVYYFADRYFPVLREWWDAPYKAESEGG